MRVVSFSHAFFASAMISLGILGLIYGDFALVWQPVPKDTPGREILAYLCGLLMLFGGFGLLWTRTQALAARTLLLYLLLWLILLRLPKVISSPQIELSWLGCGETSIMVAGAWAVYSSRANAWDSTNFGAAIRANSVGISRYLFGLAVIPCGLSHLFYTVGAASLLPKWFPWHIFWVHLTGVAYIAAGVAIFCGIYPRLASTLTAVMMAIITLVVWFSGVISAPTDRLPWTAFLTSMMLVAGAAAVAGTYRGMSWQACIGWKQGTTADLKVRD